MSTTTPTFTISPSTVYFSSTGKTNSHATLEITFTNPAGAPTLDLKGMVVMLPCGPNGSDITTAGQFGAISPSMKDPQSPWKPSLGAVTGEVDVLPKSGSHVSVPAGSSYVIRLEHITLTPVAGTAEIKAFYIDVGGSRSPEQKLDVVKSASSSAILDFISTPASISPGNSSKLSWKTALIDYVELNPGDGSHLNANGNKNVQPNGTTIYTLWAYGKNVILSQQRAVVVDRPLILSFGPKDGIASVDYGTKATLIWTCNEDTHSVGMNPPPSKVLKPNDSLEVGPLTQDMQFELIAYGDTRSNFVTQSTPISINPPEIISFATSPPSPPGPIKVHENTVVDLTWVTKSTWMVSMSPSPNPPIPGGQVSGSTKFTITGSTTITLTALGTDGRKVSQSLQFEVIPKS